MRQCPRRGLHNLLRILQPQRRRRQQPSLPTVRDTSSCCRLADRWPAEHDGRGAPVQRVASHGFRIERASDAEVHELRKPPTIVSTSYTVPKPPVPRRRRARRHESGAFPTTVVCGRGPPLEELTRRLLAADREDRPRSAVDVCEALARVEHTMLALDHAADAAALLDALCARRSEQAWASVCRFLIARAESSDLVSRATRLLDCWPDHLRRAPLSWWQQVRREGTHPLWALARSLDLSGHALDDQDARSLASQPALTSVTHLSLGAPRVPGALGALGALTGCGQPRWTRRSTMDTMGNFKPDFVSFVSFVSFVTFVLRSRLTQRRISLRSSSAPSHGRCDARRPLTA